MPVGDIDKESMNGGDKETPEDGGTATERLESVHIAGCGDIGN